MVFNKMPTDVLALFIIAVVLITYTIPTDEALSCFSSTSVVLVGVLSVLAAGLIHSGVLLWIVRNLLRKPNNYLKALVRIFIPAAFMSAFISNIAVVQLFISAVKMWCKELKISPSRLLIPLSYASTLGGLCTIIGSAPNLVLAEFYADKTQQQINFFAPFIPGICCCVVGMITTCLFHRLLPARKSPEESFESSSDYTLEFLVPTDCPSIGETVMDASLYKVNGGQLIEIVRFDREVISPVPKDEFILGGDRLVYSGQINSLLELRNSHGLVNATHHVFSVNEISKNRKLQTASVDINSPLVGHTMGETDFEDKNGVVLVAVAREGERISAIPREVELRAGDTLLFEGAKLCHEHFENNLNFFDSIPLPQGTGRVLLSSGIMLGMILLSALKIMPLINSCFLAVLLMCFTGCLSTDQLQRAVNWKLLLVFAGSVCLGRAIDITGIAQYIANSILHITNQNALLSLILMCATATFVTEFISNTTVAAVFAPIAISTASELGANPMTFIIGLMMAVSCSFATPVGSETNTLVYGPGGYKFFDYMRIGLCMNVLMLITSLIAVNIVYPL